MVIHSPPMVRSCVFVALFILSVSHAFAVEITEQLPNGLYISAEYVEGKPDKPVLLILHGFLQTRHNVTVNNLSNQLSSDGYSVLTPTLSLGVSRRKYSLPCETTHPHMFEDDLMELHFWMQWLEKKGAKSIVFIGHSTGNVQLVAYVKKYKPTKLQKIIAISLVEYAREFGGRSDKEQIQQARRNISAGSSALGHYKLSYCNNYVAPAKAFLSYANWNSQKITETIRTIQTPAYMIYGSNDERMQNGWVDVLTKTRIHMHVVAGANHFFSDTFEFDLYENVLQILTDKHKR